MSAATLAVTLSARLDGYNLQSSSFSATGSQSTRIEETIGAAVDETPTEVVVNCACIPANMKGLVITTTGPLSLETDTNVTIELANAGSFIVWDAASDATNPLGTDPVETITATNSGTSAAVLSIAFVADATP